MKRASGSSESFSARPIQDIARCTRRPISCSKPSRMVRCFDFRSSKDRSGIDSSNSTTRSKHVNGANLRIIPVFSRQYSEVAPTRVNEVTQPGGFEHFDLFTPLVKKPGHLEPSARSEAHDQAAVGERFLLLLRMKEKFQRGLRRARCEFPCDRT